jgi:lysozyme family protein
MRQNFDDCLALTLRAEGGFTDRADDPGGATNMGITRATLAGVRGHAVSKADVRALTRAEAAQIYRTIYWSAVRGDELPSGVDAVVFDHAVNSGPKAAVRALQGALGFQQDGVMSRRCLRASQAADPAALVGVLCTARMNFLKRLSTWLVFRRGWTARMETLERAALALCVAARDPEPAATQDPSRAAAQTKEP